MLKRNTIAKSQKQKKGQSTVEYIVLVAAVVAAALFMLKPNGLFRTSLNTTLGSQMGQMEDMSTRLSDSQAAATTP